MANKEEKYHNCYFAEAKICPIDYCDYLAVHFQFKQKKENQKTVFRIESAAPKERHWLVRFHLKMIRIKENPNDYYNDKIFFNSRFFSPSK